MVADRTGTVLVTARLGERAQGQDPADAEAAEIDLMLAGDFLHHREGGKVSVSHVVIQTGTRMCSAGVCP